MGKPIAGRNKSPFGVSGINVDAAVLTDGTKLTNVRISKQRSINVFDLISADGTILYPFVKITGVDKNGVNLDPSESPASLAESLSSGTFCISIADADGESIGFAVRLLLNKVILQDGSSVFLTDYSEQGFMVVLVTGITMTPSTASIAVGATRQLSSIIAPTNATNKAVSYSSSDSSVATVDANGLVTAVSDGTATITVTSDDGSFTATTVITVTA